MKRAVTITLKSLTGLLVLIAIVLAGTVGYVRTHDRQILSVQTGSMQPAITAGDAVIVRTDTQELAVGDMISFHSNVDNSAKIITHRIMSLDPARGLIITKGDALETADLPISYGQVIGRVQRVVPFAGYGLDYMRRPLGLISAVYLPAAIMATYEVRRLMRYYASQHYRLYSYPW